MRKLLRGGVSLSLTQDDLPSKAVKCVKDCDWWAKAAGSHIPGIFSYFICKTEATMPSPAPNLLQSISSLSFWCSLAGSDQLKRSTRHAKRAAECLLSHCGKQQEQENASGTLQESEVAFVEI